MKELSFLLKHIGKYDIIGRNDRLISSIEFDSREVKPGDDDSFPIYLAQRGTQVDGHLFINQAIDKGASTIICEVLPKDINSEITYILVADSSVVLGKIASAFYDNPSTKLKLVGITGTNGKTTTVTLLHRLFVNLGYASGMLSTIENKINDEVIPSTHTTPDAVTLNKLLYQMVLAGCQFCFMEVSSHSICQHRIAGLTFAGAIFSNITHDHLDFHKTFANYIKAKKSFFDKLSKKSFALTNIDDKNGRVMVQNSKTSVYTYSLQTAADFKGKIVDNSFEGLDLYINNQEVFFKLTGKFNAYNLLAIFGTARLLGLPADEILVSLSNLESAPGRFQLVRNQRGCTAVIDYAHTPDALNNVLSTIKEITKNNVEIITVVGCGGDRDALKRPVMAATACKYSSKVILTSDNPRTEDPNKILSDMEEGIPVSFKKNVLIIENRKEAIKTACLMLPDNAVLLVAGKGHENYQEINHVKHHFDDMEIVCEYFNH